MCIRDSYKVPNAPSVSLSTSGSNTGTGLSFSHSGMDMTDVNSVQYKLQKYNGSAYADYTSGAANQTGSTGLPALPDGIYRVAVWGVNKGGAAGSAGYSGSLTVDKTPPALTLSGPSTTAQAPSGIKSPKITWSASDTNLSTVQYSVDGGAYSLSLIHIYTDHFGRIVQVEVGALMVGKICNFKQEGSFRRGEEKGMFQFGGSTIVLLLRQGSAQLDQELLDNTVGHMETIVKIGEEIGRSI